MILLLVKYLVSMDGFFYFGDFGVVINCLYSKFFVSLYGDFISCLKI